MVSRKQVTDNPKIRGVYEHPKGTDIWYICYFDGEGKRHRQKVGRRALAIKVYQQRKTEIWEGRFIPKTPGAEATFQQIADERMAAKKPHLAPRSYRADNLRLAWLTKQIGSLPVRAVTPQKIEETLRKLGDKGRSHATVNRYRSLMSSIFAVAVRDGRALENPVKKVSRRRESPGRIRFLLAPEEPKLRKAIRAKWKDREPEFDLSLNTGMRKAEQFGLRWADVNMQQKILTVFGKTGRRFININAPAKKALLKLHRLSNGSAFVCPHKKNEQQQDYRRWFEHALRDAKVANFRWHDLRHTFASRLVMSGVDLRTVQVLLGHKSIVTTMRYAHLSQAHQQAAVEKLENWKRGAHRTATGSSGPKRKVIQLPLIQQEGL
jgi:site-specific recombinase XerD